ncbi:MAG TPA: hypothetical protein PLF90_05300 [bacterium]|nr:hypothetical protein [bacterium]
MKKGQVLLLVFLIVLIIGILGIGLLHMSGMESIQLRRQIHYLQALNIAEAGIERTLWKMASTPGWKDGYTEEVLENGFYTVLIEELPTPNRYKITSTGKVGYGFGSILKTIYLEVEVRSKKWPFAFDYGLFWGNPSGSSSPLNLSNGVSVIGNVFVYGNINIGNNASVTNGSVYSTGTVTGGGTYQVGELPDPLPEKINFDTSSYDQLINIAYQKPKKDFKLKNRQSYNLNGEILYVNGNVEVSNNCKIYGPGKIVATGDILIENNSEISGNVDLIANGTVTLRNNVVYQSDRTIIYGKTGITVWNNDNVGEKILLYTPGKLEVSQNVNVRGILWGGNVDLENNAYIKGAVYGDYFENNKIRNNVCIEYDPTIFEFDPPPGVPPGEGLVVKKIHWSEDNF